MFGLDLPALPGSYLTRQVICVSCQEPFVVSEGRILRDKKQKIRESNWRLARDQLFGVGLRYEQNRYRQEVRTASRADPNIHLPKDEKNGGDNYINCPRCGADNRTWLQILSARQWRQRFPAAFLSIIVATFLGLMALLFSVTESISLAQAFIIAFLAVVTARLTADDLTSMWPQIRMQRHIHRFVPRRRFASLESPIGRGIILIILFAGVFPWLFFQVGPRAMQFGSRSIRATNNDSNRAIISDKTQPPELYDDFNAVFNSEFTAFFYDFSRMKSGNPQDIQFLVLNLDQLSTSLTEQTEAYRKQLVAYFQDPPKTPVQVQNEAESRQIRGIADNLLFLALWFMIVGFANVFAVLLSNAAVNQYASFIDRQLPPPIFTNLANMTRVVAWEAKRALQIDGDMGHIQWMEVHRNEVGGVNLIGLHRDAPTLEPENNTFNQKVQAQRYLVSTDMWGRIRDTTIRDVRVSRSVLSPEQRWMQWQAGLENPPNISLQKPPILPGNDLAQDFFAGPTKAPKSPKRTATVEAPTQKMRNVVNEETAVQPPIRLLTPPPIQPETSEEKTDRLCGELAQILNDVFTEKELKQLYATLNLDYARFTGSRLGKCQDLVNFYRHRQRLAELVQTCVEMHPYELWGDIFDLYDE